MNTALDMINRALNPVFDGFFALLSFASPVWVLVILSALVGFVMLNVWRFLSNQAGIKDVRNQIAAHLLATRLFKDDLSVTFRAQRQIIWQAMRLLFYSLKPVVIMFIPFTLLISQVGLRYEFRPFKSGELIHVTATLKPETSADALLGPGSELKLPQGFTADRLDPCRAIPIRTADWRLRAEKPGDFTLRFGQNLDTIELPVHVDDGFVRISSLRGGPLMDRILYSADPSIPDASIYESIRIRYEPRATPIFGLNAHWLLTLFVLSIVFALLFKPFMKVHI